MLHKLAVPIAILLAAAGCHSPSNPSPSPSCNWPHPNGTISVAIDGTPWAVSGAEGGLHDFQFGISAGGLDCAFFNVTIYGDVLAKGPTTYSIEADTPRIVAYYSLPGVGPGPDYDVLQWRAQSAFEGVPSTLMGNGAVTLTTVTAVSASGTFSFSLVPFTKAVTGTRVITGNFMVTF